MTVQGNQLEILQTIAHIQELASVETVEDLQIAEEVELDVGLVKGALEVLAEKGYVQLEKVERLASSGYLASLTPEGQTALEFAR